MGSTFSWDEKHGGYQVLLAQLTSEGQYKVFIDIRFLSIFYMFMDKTLKNSKIWSGLGVSRLYLRLFYERLTDKEIVSNPKAFRIT